MIDHANTFKHADGTSAFVVNPYTVDGYGYPSGTLYQSPFVGGVNAVAAHTSLTLTGKGVPEYGDIVQNNLLYLMEHFANSTRPNLPSHGQIWFKTSSGADVNQPLDPSVRGLYLYDTDAAWKEVVVNGQLANDFDAAGKRITNVAPPTQSTDAATVAYAEATYLPLTGGNMAGTTTFVSGSMLVMSTGSSLSVQSPVAPDEAANKSYVDATVASLASLVSTTYVGKAGDTMTGDLHIGSNASLIIDAGGTGLLNMGSKQITNVGVPTASDTYFAATVGYVNTHVNDVISALPLAADGVVYAGSLNPSTGVLTLNRTLSLPDVIVGGNFAPFVHAHNATNVSYDLSVPYSQSFVTPALSASPNYPQPSVAETLQALDRGVYDTSRNARRIVLTSTGGSAFDLNYAGNRMFFKVGSHKLQVFVNGTKQYVNDRGFFVFTYTPLPGSPTTPVTATTNIGLTPGSYPFNITLGVTVHSVVISVPSTSFTFTDLATAITAAFASNSITATVSIEEFYDATVDSGSLDFIITNNASGTGSDVVVTYALGELFSSIPFFSGTTAIAPAATTRGYAEVGTPGSISSQITFTSSVTSGALIECILLP